MRCRLLIKGKVRNSPVPACSRERVIFNSRGNGRAWLGACAGSVFWGSMAYVLIGGTAVGTVLTLAFLPALYAIWFRVRHADAVRCNHGQKAPPVADLIHEHTADPHHVTLRDDVDIPGGGRTIRSTL